MKTISESLKRCSALIGATGVLGLTLLSTITLSGSTVSAAAAGAQVTNRSLKLSSGVVSSTNNSYDVQFTVPTSYTMKAVIVDFCTSPIIGSTCTAPTGFAATATAPTNNPDSVSNNVSVSGWTASILNSGRTYQIANATGVATTGGTSVVNFSFAGVTNPSTVGTFYARVETFTVNNPTYTAATSDSYQDYGAMAVSTSNPITISATVQETLNFCVVGAVPTAACANASANLPNVILGTGTPQTIDSQALYTNGTVTPTYMQTSTNALNGTSITMSNNFPAASTCSGLSRNTTGSPCEIAGSGSFGTITAGSGKFGLNVGTSSLASGGSGTVTANANYGSTAGSYGMGNNVYSTYGDVIASATGPLVSVNNQLTFAATAAPTTPAGIYTTQETLVATGKF